MNDLNHSYKKILSSYIDHLHKQSGYVDPLMVNRARFFVRAFFVAYLYTAPRFSKGSKFSLKNIYSYLTSTYGTGNFLSLIIEKSDSFLRNIFDNEDVPTIEDSISSIYQRLLSIETSGLTITEGKEYRNKLGSYYTPIEFSDYIVKRVLASYLSKNNKQSLLKAKIVDFSCGCGVFFISLLSELKTMGFDRNEIKKVANNFYGCDVDPIAFEVAKLSIVDYCDSNETYSTISEHFEFGNFLIHSNLSADIPDKIELAMSGYIYHPRLSVNDIFQREYDIILGNPPWEKIRFEEKKFYSQFSDNIANINFKFDLPLTIDSTKRGNEFLDNYSCDYIEQLESSKGLIKKNPFFGDSTHGELNTCSLFADAAYKLLAADGAAGLLVKSTLLTAKVNKLLFQKIKNRIEAVYDFINRRKIFDIDGRERFSILLLGKPAEGRLHLGMNLQTIGDIEKKCGYFPLQIFHTLNPETGMIPNLTSSRDIELLSRIYGGFGILSQNFPEIKYGRLVHLTNHIQFIERTPNRNNIPVFEGKFFSLFDNSYSGFNEVPLKDRYKSKAVSRKLNEDEKKSGIIPESRFFIQKHKWSELSNGFNSDFMLAWHSLSSATNTRTCVATILPFIPGSQSIQFLVTQNPQSLIYLAGIFNSIVFDYIIKNKMNGIDLTQSITNQIPVPSIEEAENTELRIWGSSISIKDLIINIVRAFYNNDTRITDIWNRIPIKKENELEPYDRNSLFILLDCVVGKLYKMGVDDMEYLLSFFNGFYSDKDKESILRLFANLN